MPMFIFSLIILMTSLYPRWYGNISFDPWDVLDCWDVNGLEIILPEISTFAQIPCYCYLLLLDEKKHNFVYFWPQEAQWVDVHFLPPLFSKLSRGYRSGGCLSKGGSEMRGLDGMQWRI